MKTKVLLVDDEEGYVQPLSERLTARGFDVSVAYNGESALELVERQNFDVVLLDVMMPGTGGIETFKQIRNIDFLVHVIMLTGYAEVETAIEEIRSGAFDYLVKPVQIDHLEERIRFAHHHKTLQEKRLRDKMDGMDRGGAH